MFKPRVIEDHRGKGTAYLTRIYLIGRPKAADGLDPFDAHGNYRKVPIKERRLFGVAAYLHKFHRSDDSSALHSHPWKWAFSFVLWRGYWEDRLQPDLTIKRLRVRPFTFNFIRGNDYHRIDLIDGKPAYTLFFTGGKTGKSWHFFFDGMFYPWRVFLERCRS